MLMESVLTVCVVLVIIYALFKGCNININVTLKQEFSQEDRQLLEDIYNDKGELKRDDLELQNAFDEIVKNVNDIMLGVEDDTNG